MKHNCTYACKLTNLSKNGHLRTDIVEGGCDTLPAVGMRFIMIADSLDPKKDARLITTSPVQRIGDEVAGCNEQLIEFWTMNTHYQLEVNHG